MLISMAILPVVAVDEFGVRGWSMFDDDPTFFFPNLLRCPVEDDMKIYLMPLTVQPCSGESLPEFFCPTALIDVTHVFGLTSPEVVCAPNIKQISSASDHVYDLGLIHFLEKIILFLILLKYFLNYTNGEFYRKFCQSTGRENQ